MIDENFFGLIRTSFGGGDVSLDDAMSCASLSAVVGIISLTIASMPIRVLEKQADGSSKQLGESDGGIVYRMLKNAPNPNETIHNFIAQVISDRIVYGNAFIHFAGDAIYRIPPRMVSVSSDPMRVSYSIAGKQHDLIHLRGTGRTQYVGDPVTVRYRRLIHTAIAIERFADSYFSNGGWPTSVIQVPTAVPADKRAEVQRDLAERMSGANVGKTLVLDAGKELKTYPVQMDGASLSVLRRSILHDFCRAFGVPPVMVGDIADASYASAEQQLTVFFQALLPYMVEFEQAFQRLCPPGIFIKFNSDGLIRTSLAERTQAMVAATGGPFYTLNEARNWLDMPPIYGGDSVLRPLNMANADGSDLSDDQKAKRSGYLSTKDFNRRVYGVK